MAKAQEEGAELKPIPLPYEMELVEMKIKDKKFVKIMQGKELSQVRTTPPPSPSHTHKRRNPSFLA